MACFIFLEQNDLGFVLNWPCGHGMRNDEFAGKRRRGLDCQSWYLGRKSDGHGTASGKS